MTPFLLGLFLIGACTLMYEIVLTRLLSVISWYYLAFISVAMAMFGMTVGALLVQLRPERFTQDQVPHRLAQAAMWMAVSLPISLLLMLAMPVNVFVSAESLFSYAVFSAIIAVPFFFSGICVCLSLTRTQTKIGATYAADLLGAAAGCAASVALLKILDAPSAVFTISAIAFVAAGAYAAHAKETARGKLFGLAVLMLIVAAVNSSTMRGIQPIWSKGVFDTRAGLLAEIWNPISKVRVMERTPSPGPPWMWGPSPKMPDVSVETLELDIDNDAGTPLMRYHDGMKEFEFLRYDVTSLAAQLRAGGSAAIIGLGGGRDALTALVNGFHRVVGIDVNCAIVDVTTRRFVSFSGFDKMPALEVHCDEARSYLTRSNERFDVIQASLVDTWAATAAGSLSLTENSLYTVDAWKIFFAHLKPRGLMTFTRYYSGPELSQTYRLFSVAWATLLSEGIQNPGPYVALIRAGGVATLLVSNQPLSADDLQKLRSLVNDMGFSILYMPGEPVTIPQFQRIASARSLRDLSQMRYVGEFDISPAYDSSPFFFNSVRLREVPQLLRAHVKAGNYRATVFLLAFMFCAALLVGVAILLPVKYLHRASTQATSLPAGGVVYFTAIGLAFTAIEIAMMQQLSIFLGHPIYSLVIVLAGLIFFTGVGSLASEKITRVSGLTGRMPAFVSAAVVFVYFAVVLPVIHSMVAANLWQRAAISLALIAPCGLVMGFCFPVGLRRMTALGLQEHLPWMWALNGAAAVLASFIAILISMEVSISATLLTGAALYVLAGFCLPPL